MSDATKDLVVRDNRLVERFEVEVDGLLAYSKYHIKPGSIRFIHTIVPEQLEGRGVGSAIARAALDSARARGLRVIPQCPFIRAYIERHPEYQDLTA